MRNSGISRDRRYALTGFPFVAVLLSGEERTARVIGAERAWPSIWVEGFAPVEYAWVTVERFARAGGRFPFEPDPWEHRLFTPTHTHNLPS